MARRVFLVHGWAATESRHWFPWLLRELQELGYETRMIRMPHIIRPVLEEWIDTIAAAVGEPTEDTIFITHSIGTIAVAHWLERAAPGKRVCAVIAVAPLVLPRFRPLFPTFFEKPFDPVRVMAHVREIIVLHDPKELWAPFPNAEYLRDACGAELILCPGRNHFNDLDGVRQVPEVVDQVLKLG